MFSFRRSSPPLLEVHLSKELEVGRVHREGLSWSRQKLTACWIALICILAVTGIGAWAQMDAVLNTVSGRTFASIQEAVDDSETYDGDLIEVDSDLYDSGLEPAWDPGCLIVIDKSVTIQSTLGAGETVIDARDLGTAVSLDADDICFEGFTIINTTDAAVVCSANGATLTDLYLAPADGDGFLLTPGTRWATIEGNVVDGSAHTPCVSDMEWAGLRAHSSSDNVIMGNELRHTCLGIHLGGASNDNVIQGNNLWDFGWAGIIVHSSCGPDAHAPGDPARCLILNNTVTGGAHGISCGGNIDGTTIDGNFVSDVSEQGIAMAPSEDCLGFPEDNLVINNILENCRMGINLEETSGCSVQGNHISSTEHCAVAVQRSTGCAVSGNELFSCSHLGIHILESDGCDIEDNTLWDCVFPLELYGSAQCLVTHNTVHGATGNGIHCEDAVCDNSIIENWIYDCEGAGLAIEESPDGLTNTEFRQNIVENCAFGMFLGGQGNTVEGNAFTNYSRTGMQILGSDHVVADNAFTGAMDSRTGIFVIGSLDVPDEQGTRLLIEGNTISTGFRGIILYMARDNEVRGNVISGHSGRGIMLSLADENTIEANVVTENGCGFTIPWFDATNNTVSNNTLTGNINGAVFTSAPSSFFQTSQEWTPITDSLGNVYQGNLPALLTSCAIPQAVPLDVKPCSCPNPFNTTDKGVLPVAILGSDELNVRDIDSASLTLAGVPLLRDAYEDVAAPYEPWIGKVGVEDCTTAGPDGFEDLVLKFRAEQIMAALGPVFDREVVMIELNGFLFDGTPIVGEDVIRILDADTHSMMEVEPPLLRIMAAPNPVEQSGVTFWVDGVDAAQISIQILDLSGREVFASGMQPGVSFHWSLIDNQGNRVPNGVYLCHVTAVDTQGDIIRTEVKPIAVIQ